MKITIKKSARGKNRPKPEDESNLGFGNCFSDHMFLMNHDEKIGWHDPRIEPYALLTLDPAALVLHYGQEIFEGLKAYRRSDGGIQLFRPLDNFERMNRSADRLCMPRLDKGFALRALKELLLLDQDWVPHNGGASLYIRPTMIATHPSLGVKVSSQYLYYIITSPVGAYFPQGFSPTRIMVSDRYVRAVPGGVGSSKTSGNYAASLLATEEAHRKGYAQVLWLDGIHRAFAEEVGTSNIFFVFGEKLVTPPLRGTILPGITRDSIIRLARDWGMEVEERPVGIDEVIKGAGNGSLREMFSSGTAAIVSPVGELSYRGESFTVNGQKVGNLSRRLYDELLGIQYGNLPDPHDWIEKIT